MLHRCYYAVLIILIVSLVQMVDRTPLTAEQLAMGAVKVFQLSFSSL